MVRILLTSGPTRQYLDPVRYLTNASSGRMGSAIAQSALNLNHEVVIVTGPVNLTYPAGCQCVRVVSTEEMLDACRRIFPTCHGMIGVAAPCDYRPVAVHSQKIAKTGEPLLLNLVETPDIVATLAAAKKSQQWLVGFALETQDQRFRAITKMQKKSCDLMVVNGPQAMDSSDNDVEILGRDGTVIDSVRGPKNLVADRLMAVIQAKLIQRVV